MLKTTFMLLLSLISLNISAETLEDAQAKEYADKLKVQIVQFCQKQNLETNSDMRACIRETMDDVIARMLHDQKVKELQMELNKEDNKQ